MALRKRTSIWGRGLDRVVEFVRPGLKIKIEYRTKPTIMGRFGGGWSWELGFQAGRNWLSRGFILNLLVFSIRVRLGKEA